MTYRLRGPSGRLWKIGETHSDGTPIDESAALRIYADLASGDPEAWQLVELVDGAWVEVDWPVEERA